MNAKSTGQFIQNLRKEQNLTQKDLADKIGCTDKAVSRWETGLGLPDVGILLNLSQALNVSVNEILRGEKIIAENDDNNTTENTVTERVISTTDETVIEILKESETKINKKNSTAILFGCLCLIQLICIYVVPQFISYYTLFDSTVFMLYSTVALCIISGLLLDKLKWLYPLFITISLFAAIPFSGSDYHIYVATGAFALVISYGIVAICHAIVTIAKYINNH